MHSCSCKCRFSFRIQAALIIILQCHPLDPSDQRNFTVFISAQAYKETLGIRDGRVWQPAPRWRRHRRAGCGACGQRSRRRAAGRPPRSRILPSPRLPPSRAAAPPPSRHAVPPQLPAADLAQRARLGGDKSRRTPRARASDLEFIILAPSPRCWKPPSSGWSRMQSPRPSRRPPPPRRRSCRPRPSRGGGADTRSRRAHRAPGAAACAPPNAVAGWEGCSPCPAAAVAAGRRNAYQALASPGSAAAPGYCENISGPLLTAPADTISTPTSRPPAPTRKAAGLKVRRPRRPAF
jgi:hypothetical protein